jgi:hypothetical protein
MLVVAWGIACAHPEIDMARNASSRSTLRVDREFEEVGDGRKG